ncbi:MAG: tRNA (N6-threonylcarbamoyladenosine(37)-N6)-methyltransferase TrmO [Chloroflexi bacterium]|nr:tRNA (N6-threonylcarbamoyladenosine(37)-N6)-methyltransferase TrmO [Chloroflexota bacterium]
MQNITYAPIGLIHSPFKEPAGMPIQSVAAKGVAGSIELAPEYWEGLLDLEGFSHLILIYHLHLVQGSSLVVTPFLDDQVHGVFATRSPKRPNPIGFSIVRLLKIEEGTLHIEDVDLVDGTPLLDIKPYVPLFDNRAEVRIGWFAKKIEQVYQAQADQRFR